LTKTFYYANYLATTTATATSRCIHYSLIHSPLTTLADFLDDYCFHLHHHWNVRYPKIARASKGHYEKTYEKRCGDFDKKASLGVYICSRCFENKEAIKYFLSQYDE
jgi:hypothetical protein